MLYYQECQSGSTYTKNEDEASDNDESDLAKLKAFWKMKTIEADSDDSCDLLLPAHPGPPRVLILVPMLHVSPRQLAPLFPKSQVSGDIIQVFCYQRQPKIGDLCLQQTL